MLSVYTCTYVTLETFTLVLFSAKCTGSARRHAPFEGIEVTRRGFFSVKLIHFSVKTDISHERIIKASAGWLAAILRSCKANHMMLYFTEVNARNLPFIVRSVLQPTTLRWWLNLQWVVKLSFLAYTFILSICVHSEIPQFLRHDKLIFFLLSPLFIFYSGLDFPYLWNPFDSYCHPVKPTEFVTGRGREREMFALAQYTGEGMISLLELTWIVLPLLLSVMVTGAWRRGGGGGRRVLHHCHSPIPLMLRQTMEESCCSTFKRVRVTTETKHRVVFISFLCCLSSFHVLHWRIWCNLITEFQLCFSFLFPSVLLQYPSLSLSGTIRRLIRLSWLFLNTLCWWGSSTGETGGWVGGSH